MKIKDILFEFVVPQQLTALNDLITAVETGKLTGAALDTAVKAINVIDDKAQQLSHDNTPQVAPAPQPTNEAKQLTTQQKIADLRAKMGNPKDADAVLKALQAAGLTEQKIYAFLRSAADVGREEEFQSHIQWTDKLKQTAEILADKVVNNGEIIHGAIEANKKKDENLSSEGLDEAKEATGVSMKAKIVDILHQLFDKPLRTQRDRASAERKQKLIAQFMEKCKTGIIDFNDIIASSGKQSKIDDLVSDQDREIYQEIRAGAFDAVPSTTAGAWGPGEIGLSLLATPVTKGKVGDLRVRTAKGAVEIELKGMKEAKAGGRFNSNAVAKAKDAKRNYLPVFKEVFADLTKILNSKKIKTKDTTQTFTVISNQKTGETKYKDPGIFDMEAINKVWNPQLILPASKINPRATLAAVKKLLMGIATASVLDEGQKYAVPSIKEMMADPDIIQQQPDGGFILNFIGIQANICKILYSVYAGVDKKGVIMYFNTTTSNYYIVKGPNDMKKQIKNGKLKVGNAIINFAAGQAPASPQVGIE